MTKKERTTFIVNTLETLCPNPPIPLDHKDAYTLLIAVLLSAQCTDVRVNQVTPALFKLADNPYTMATIPVEDIRAIIKPCGLSPKKSQAISDLSKILIEKHNGMVPNTFTDPEALPRLDIKLTDAVAESSVWISGFSVDTHCLMIGGEVEVEQWEKCRANRKRFKKIFAEDLWNKLHLQIIYYGRAYCPAKAHNLDKCIICSKIDRK
ncbi:MAG: hypothetical protein R2807_10285 [Chitinophagales bacterium]